MDFGVVHAGSLHFFTPKIEIMKKTTNATRNEHNEMENAITCGNCWGHQEYDYSIKKAIRKTDRNVYTSFIRKFVKRYLPI